MKKHLLFFIALLSLTACKNKVEEEFIDPSLLQEIKADFYYESDAAVLMGKDFIYGVKLNRKAHELGKQVNEVKKEPTDMVPVVIEGIINKREETEEEGWDYVVTIAEIIEIGEAPSNPDVKIE